MHYLKCGKCGCVDRTKARHVGTSIKMRCKDCAGVDGKATLCRNCCPTEHGCKLGWVDDVEDEEFRY